MSTVLDRPLTMAGWNEETGRDYSIVYGFMSSLLSEESSGGRFEKCLHGKLCSSCKCHAQVEKSRFVPEATEGAKAGECPHSQNLVVFDFDAVHRERALNAKHLNKGRRWRKKHYGKIKMKEWYKKRSKRNPDAMDGLYALLVFRYTWTWPTSYNLNRVFGDKSNTSR